MAQDEYKREDRQIVRRISEGDREAFHQLFTRFHSSLCRFACSICKDDELSRDIVQEVFFNIWNKREQWVLTESLSAYLYRAVRNGTIDQLRIRKKRVESPLEDPFSLRPHTSSEPSDPSIQPDRKEWLAEQDGLVQRVWRCVDDMPVKRRRAFTLYRRHGLSYQEIAVVMNLSRKTVENHIAKALEELRTSLRNAITEDSDRSIRPDS